LEETTGIILKHLDYKESSQILYVYTEEGVKSYLIHGGKKLKSPFLSNRDTISYVRIHASGKGSLKTVKEVETLVFYKNIKSSIEKVTYVSHLLELVELFSRGELNHEKAFPFVKKILDRVETEDDYIPYINMFEAKLLYLLGVNPLFSECVICKDTDDLSFSVKEGGMTCHTHTSNGEVHSQECIELFQFLYYYDLAKPSSIETNVKTIIELRHLLDDYYSYHLNVKTKSRTVLEGLIGY